MNLEIRYFPAYFSPAPKGKEGGVLLVVKKTFLSFMYW